MEHLLPTDLCLCDPLFPYNKTKPILKPQTPSVEVITTIKPKASLASGNEIMSTRTHVENVGTGPRIASLA